MSIFQSVEMNNVPKISCWGMTPLVVRFVRRLVLCIAFTFPPGVLLPRQVVPAIIFLCAAGDPLGFAGAVLLQVWVLTLVDMWRHVWWDARLIRATRVSSELVPEQPLAETTPEI